MGPCIVMAFCLVEDGHCSESVLVKEGENYFVSFVMFGVAVRAEEVEFMCVVMSVGWLPIDALMSATMMRMFFFLILLTWLVT